MILGSGSASFEILRYLVERLPAMTTPRWVRSLNQPIAVRNVITYLIGCLEHEETSGQTYDIGGPDILTYRDLLDIYAEEANLPKRLIIPVPVLTPTLSALWIHLISPVPSSIALPLTEGLTSDAVCTENRIQSISSMDILRHAKVHCSIHRKAARCRTSAVYAQTAYFLSDPVTISISSDRIPVYTPARSIASRPLVKG